MFHFFSSEKQLNSSLIFNFLTIMQKVQQLDPTLKVSVFDFETLQGLTKACSDMINGILFSQTRDWGKLQKDQKRCELVTKIVVDLIELLGKIGPQAVNLQIDLGSRDHDAVDLVIQILTGALKEIKANTPINLTIFANSYCLGGDLGEKDPIKLEACQQNFLNLMVASPLLTSLKLFAVMGVDTVKTLGLIQEKLAHSNLVNCEILFNNAGRMNMPQDVLDTQVELANTVSQRALQPQVFTTTPRLSN